MPGTPEWMNEGRASVDLKIDRPHAARVYDALLGGKTNYPADREAARKTLESVPTARQGVVANRTFMHRVTRHLAEKGVRQFLDIGTGIPLSPNLHEIAQDVGPDSRVVYVDNDPIVLAHSRALHTSSPTGRTTYIEADASDPDNILASARLRETLNLEEPVALSMLLLLHWLPSTTDPYAVVERLMGALAPGSHLVITHLARDLDENGVEGIERNFGASGSEVNGRTRKEVEQFFTGLELLEPGLVVPHLWHPAGRARTGEDEVTPVVAESAVPIWAGVATKTG